MSAEVAVASKEVSRRRWWIHLLLVAGYFSAGIPFALSHTHRRPALLGTTGGLLLVCSVQIVVFLIVFGLACFASKASADALLLKWRPGWWTVPLGIGYSIAMRLTLGIMIVAIAAIFVATGLLSRESIARFSEDGRTAAERLVDVSAMQHNRAYFWLTITLASFVVAGLREELWRSGTLAAMRALWPGRFSGRNGEIAAIGLIAILFGLGHLSLGLSASIMAAMLGFFLGIIMVLHQSIWPAVIAHGVFDATSFALLPLALQHLQRTH